MRTKLSLLFIVAGILCAVILVIILDNRPFVLQSLQTKADTTDSFVTRDLADQSDRINLIETNLKTLDKRITKLADTANASPSATPTPIQKIILPTSIPGKTVLAVANTKGGSYTTTSFTYTPIGMYVNINCRVKCLLWVNFYTDTKNTATPATPQGYTNYYDLFIDDTDKSTVSQANFPVDGMVLPLSLNAVVPVSAGFHSIDMRAKTNGGTLESIQSTLQVMAIEQ